MNKLFALAFALFVAGQVSAEGPAAPVKPAPPANPAPVAMKPMAQKSLYERLGGKPAISAVVDDFVPRTAANPKVNFFRDGKFKNIDVVKLKGHLVAFLSMATGGPKEYKGRDMKSTHTGMKITDAEFTALAGDLAASLKKLKVPEKETNELMAIAASTKSEIVGH